MWLTFRWQDEDDWYVLTADRAAFILDPGMYSEPTDSRQLLDRDHLGQEPPVDTRHQVRKHMASTTLP